MSYPIQDIEGIGPVYGEKLAGAEIKTTEDFLKFCCEPKGRDQVAEQTGISPKLVLTWANMADMMRINGVGPEFAELLEAAGVDTVKELRHRRSDNLAAKMAEVNEEKKLTRQVPAESQIATWIEAAKTLDPKISH